MWKGLSDRILQKHMKDKTARKKLNKQEKI